MAETKSFSRFSAGPHHLDSGHPAVVVVILDSGRLASLPDLNLLDFSIWRILQTKDQATCHVNLTIKHPSIAEEWDLLVRNTSARPATHSKAAGKQWSLRKMKLKFN
jgi:hypothetical protein